MTPGAEPERPTRTDALSLIDLAYAVRDWRHWSKQLGGIPAVGAHDASRLAGAYIDALEREKAAEVREQQLRDALACEHNRSHDHPDNRPDLWDYVEHEGKTWNRCRLCGLLELWEGGVFFKAALAQDEGKP